MIPPHTESKIRVNADPLFLLPKSLAEDDRWGIVTGNQSIDRLVATGVLCIYDTLDDEYNWVNVINQTDTFIEIATGEVLGHHRKTNLANMEITALTNDNKGIDETDLDLPPDIIAMMEDEVRTAIVAPPHLKDLDLTDPHGHITAEQSLLLARVVLHNKRRRLWDTSPKVLPPDATMCDIRIRDGELFKGQGRYIPTDPATRATLRETIESKLKRGIRESSKSPNSSTVLLVLKPGGGVQFCIDYRALIKAVEPDAYTLSTVQENLVAMSGDKYLTRIDLKEAFWSVPLTSQSRELTAFHTPDGLFQYRFMPMGLRTASAVFC
jgi:hypothetical protein